MVHLNNWEGCIKEPYLGFLSSLYIGKEILHGSYQLIYLVV